MYNLKVYESAYSLGFSFVKQSFRKHQQWQLSHYEGGKLRRHISLKAQDYTSLCMVWQTSTRPIWFYWVTRVCKMARKDRMPSPGGTVCFDVEAPQPVCLWLSTQQRLRPKSVLICTLSLPHWSSFACTFVLWLWMILNWCFLNYSLWY